MEVKLVVVGGDAKPTEIKLKLPAIIGRGRSASLTLPHPLVSRQHCELYESDGNLFVRDMGSLNGTFVGEEKIEEAALDSGSLLTVGNVTFRPIYGDAAAEAGDQPVEFDMADQADEGTEPMDFDFVDDDEIEEADEVEEVEDIEEVDDIEEVNEADLDDVEEIDDIEEVPDVEEVEEADPLDPPEPSEIPKTLKSPEQTEAEPKQETQQAPEENEAPKKDASEQDDQFLQFLDDDDDADGSDDDDLSSFLKDFK